MVNPSSVPCHAHRQLSRGRALGRRAFNAGRVATCAGLVGGLVTGAVVWAVAASADTNLIVNPTFAASTSGWTANSPGALSVGSSRSTGGYSAALKNSGTSKATLALNDAKNTVPLTAKGATYTASAWVKSSQANVTLGIRMMEYSGSTLKGQQVTQVWVTDTAWRQVTVTYTAVQAGASIDLNVLGWALPAGVTVNVDDVSLVVGTPNVVPTPTPAPTQTPTAVPTPKPTPTPAGWRLTWADEFNGTSVDTGKWRVRNNDYATNEYSIVTNRPSNVRVANGVLNLTAQREKWSIGSFTRDYTSGYLDTMGKFSQKYGRWEMRASLPDNKGMWPAFWLRSDSTMAELDVMEAVGGAGTTVFTMHRSTNGGAGKYGYEHKFPAGESPTGWHTYAVEWEPAEVRFYVDGILRTSRNTSQLPWLATDFNTPMNMRLNLQVGGSMPAWYGLQVDSSTKFPAVYAVDYVRVYSR